MKCFKTESCGKICNSMPQTLPAQDLTHCSPLPSDGRNDIPGYNERLEQLGGKCTWQSCPWLFGECYLYRYGTLAIAFSSTGN